mmetsp:Transcript_7263/g.10709  ORF Transcript_7263/g.10709 Transcript_7263/m.10709 type:complete len:399 (+) Transcript_7263:47-1243(+)
MKTFYVISHPQSSSILTDEDAKEADGSDDYNRPRQRQSIILSTLRRKYMRGTDGDDASSRSFCIQSPTCKVESIVETYSSVHCSEMLKFLRDSWESWVTLGPEGRDPGSFHPSFFVAEDKNLQSTVPPLVPSQVALHRDFKSQRAGNNVMGQIGYYCTDLLTPIVSTLREEMEWDAAVVRMALDKLISEESNGSYAVTIHPGHHASYESFGGYCYVNHAAMSARYLQQHGHAKVAVLDVDYHAGNGTISTFYSDPSVLVISIHCDPDYEYPFNSGFADQTGSGDGEGATLNIPLPPGVTFDNAYREALVNAVHTITEFGASAMVVSLGLDTHGEDEIATRRAGFKLKNEDYWIMGNIIGKDNGKIPTIFIQEGGYNMDVVGEAACDVIAGFHSGQCDD